MARKQRWWDWIIGPPGRRRGSGKKNHTLGVTRAAGTRRYQGRSVGFLSPPGKRRGTKGW